MEETGITTVSSNQKFVTTKISNNRGEDESRHWLPETFDCVTALKNNTLSARRHNGHTAGLACAREIQGSLPRRASNYAHPDDFLQPSVDSKQRVALVHEGSYTSPRIALQYVVSHLHYDYFIGQLTNAKELRKELENNTKIIFKCVIPLLHTYQRIFHLYDDYLIGRIQMLN